MQSNKTSLILFITTALVLTFLAGAEARDSRIYIDISSPDLRKIPMAVPYFEDKAHPERPGEAGKKMASILARGLEFHGFISILPPESYGGIQDAHWENIGADFTILGQYETTSSGITLEMKLFSVLENRVVFGKRYRGPQEKNDEMLLKFCDEIILQLTGERGVSLSQIAFVSDASGHKEVYLADILGRIRQVTKHKDLTVSPRFSPDGRKLTYTSYHSGNPNLYVTDLSQTQTTRAISRRRGLNLAPAWSPNGKTMVITLSQDGNPDLYLIDTNGVVLQRLTANSGINVSPSWSPDGKKIAFVSDRSGDPQIYIMEMKTGKVHRLTFNGDDNTEPCWSPKGDQIAYAGKDENEYHIFVISPEGGPPKKLTRYSGDHESPSWSPDGRQIVFSRNRNNERKIYAMLSNGKGLRPLFQIKGNQGSPRWSPRMDF